MFFKRKPKKEIKCENCNYSINEKYNFCPYCGVSLLDSTEIEKELQDFGMLGRQNFARDFLSAGSESSSPFSDKMIASLVKRLAKTLEKQFSGMEREDLTEAEIRNFPAGIQIRIGMQEKPDKQKPGHAKKKMTKEQMNKILTLPKIPAKSVMKRLGNKIVYELATPGLSSPEDVFVSKLESGYEIKAIGNKKVYVNSIPINLPIRGLAVSDNKLSVEFKAQ